MERKAQRERWTEGERIAQEYWDKYVADPPERRRPLPRDPRFEATAAIADRIDANHWTAEETTPGDEDRASFIRLKKKAPAAAEILVRVLAVFLGADEAVLEMLEEANPKEMRKKEITELSIRRENQEVTHSLVYSNLAECILNDEEYQRAAAFDDEAEAIQSMKKWAEETKAGPPFARQLAIGVVELVMFSALFTVPQALKKTNVCPTLSDANGLIARDEGDHMESTATEIADGFRGAPRPVKKAAWEVVTKMLKEGEAAAAPLLEWVFETGKIMDVGVEEARRWTRYRCNEFAKMVNRGGEYDGVGAKELPFPEEAKCPMPWMEMLAVTKERANFFEVKGAPYDKKVDPKTLRIPTAAELAKRPQLAAGGGGAGLRVPGAVAETLAKMKI